jgi:hypothetical protein
MKNSVDSSVLKNTIHSLNLYIRATIFNLRLENSAVLLQSILIYQQQQTHKQLQTLQSKPKTSMNELHSREISGSDSAVLFLRVCLLSSYAVSLGTSLFYQTTIDL